MQRRFLAAFARAAGIPARPGFADLKNHLGSEKLIAQLGSGTFRFHGFVEFWMHYTWVKANPAFNIEMCDRFGVHPREFDGYHYTMLRGSFFDGQRHMECIGQREATQAVCFMSGSFPLKRCTARATKGRRKGSRTSSSTFRKLPPDRFRCFLFGICDAARGGNWLVIQTLVRRGVFHGLSVKNFSAGVPHGVS